MTVTSAQGFRAAGVTAGIKASGRPDVALVVNDGPLDVAVGVFTGNRFKAAPVLWSQQAVADRMLRAVVLNSGGANACTGPAGFADTHHTAEHVATVLTAAGVETGPGDVGVCSTGLIGERLPMDLLLRRRRRRSGIAVGRRWRRGGGRDHDDRHRPQGRQRLRSGGFTVGGMAKGAGMLAPALATMLVVVTTDAAVDADTADTALREASQPELRPHRLRRVHEHERHGAPARERRLGGDARRRRSSRLR